jgi:hypothetical protein
MFGNSPGNPTFSTGIEHHQNNSFDELHGGGYAHAHHANVAL